MTRWIASLALLGAAAVTVFADVAPPRNKCSTNEEDGFFMAACLLLAATMLTWRLLKRGKLGRP